MGTKEDNKNITAAFVSLIEHMDSAIAQPMDNGEITQQDMVRLRHEAVRLSNLPKNDMIGAVFMLMLEMEALRRGAHGNG